MWTRRWASLMNVIERTADLVTVMMLLPVASGPVSADQGLRIGSESCECRAEM